MKHIRFSVMLLIALVCAGEWLGARPALAQDQHGDESATAQEGGDPNPLAFDPDLAIWTGVVFILLFFVLSRFAWPQISAALLEREKRIEGNIAAAEAMHEQAKQMLSQHEAELAGAADQVRALLEEARRDAEHTKAQIVAEAKKAADTERDRAIRDVERAADLAMKNLAESSANLAVELAGKVVRQNLTSDQQSQLVRDALSKLTAAEPSKN
jgi:F-type H+-transporting ATPase subunit b